MGQLPPQTAPLVALTILQALKFYSTSKDFMSTIRVPIDQIKENVYHSLRGFGYNKEDAEIITDVMMYL